MNATWLKSSFSFSNGNCVEVAELPGGSVGIRDSRDPGGPVLRFARGEWAAFLGGARRGDFDRSGGTACRQAALDRRLPAGSRSHREACWSPCSMALLVKAAELHVRADLGVVDAAEHDLSPDALAALRLPSAPAAAPGAQSSSA